ncbi:S-adenosylmethionine decarboxylase proenzyme [Aphelenchoides bicaudatus]|nr:S-adenosylmethionine decarboxylase proenzyme [Aphelenchoides bicaudatus]
MSVTFDSSRTELDSKLKVEDSGEKDDYFFEGAEKLLEIWFAKEDESEGGSLRSIPRNEIDKMLDVANCRVLHARSNDKLDSYVLSESSLFVSDYRMILKTCGGTRLLDAIPCILSLAKRHGGFDIVSNVYYSRKNFIKPHLQPDPHKSFNDEVEYLSNIFPDGEAYCLGPMNSADCWYLFAMSSARFPNHVDHTLEIQMSDLPQEVLKLYSQESFSTGRACTRASGLMDLIPFGTVIHEELFEPVGYSMNGLVANTDQYVTVHVTPESQFAYVSFETNQRRKCLYKQTLKVLECFKPRNFIMTMFTTNESHNGKSSQNLLWNREIPNYHRVNLQFVRLAHDTLVYAQFVQIQKDKPSRVVTRIQSSEDEDSNQSSD